MPPDTSEALCPGTRRLGEESLHNLNELIGTRVRVLQQLWLDEVSQSTARVLHWSHSELTTQWATAMTQPGARPMSR